MEKIDNFKKFIYNHPEFIDEVRANKTSWQSLYELYDLYGEDEKIWNKYISNNSIDSFSIKGLLNTIKNIDVSSLEENINNIQKAVALVEEFTKKEDNIKKETNLKETKIDNLYGESNEI